MLEESDSRPLDACRAGLDGRGHLSVWLFAELSLGQKLPPLHASLPRVLRRAHLGRMHEFGVQTSKPPRLLTGGSLASVRDSHHALPVSLR